MLQKWFKNMHKGKKADTVFSALHHCHHSNTAFKLGLNTGNKLKYFNCSKGRIKRPFLFQPHHCILCAAAACFVPHPLSLGAAAQLFSEQLKSSKRTEWIFYLF